MTETLPAENGSATPTMAELLENVVVGGDLAKLTAEQRLRYYRELCRSLKLNELTQPFMYITLNNKLTLYARKDATDQLRALHHISVSIVSREKMEDLYVVTARATTRDGRIDEAIGAVSLAGLRGEALANAIMKAETKGKRRVTLSICGLGWTDETEIDSIPGARTVRVDEATGEILDTPALPAPRAPGFAEPVGSAKPAESLERARLLEGWQRLWAEAQTLDLQPPPEPIPTNAANDAIKAAGKALRERIQSARETADAAA